MKQREVQDADNTRWTCVQALSGLGDASGADAEAAADKLERGDGTVPVACTPSGGEASVRVRLPRGWGKAAPTRSCSRPSRLRSRPDFKPPSRLPATA